MKILHIMDGPPLYTNGFLVVSAEGHAVAVDPAADEERFVESLEQENAALTYIFLTHGHYDHVGSVDALRKRYGAKVFIAKPDADEFGIEADEFFNDGDVIKLDELEFSIITTPGHTQGSVCIRCEDVLFTGDTLFAGTIGRTDFKYSSSDAMNDSLRKLRDGIQDDLQVLPGHEEFSTMDNEKAHNRYLKNA